MALVLLIALLASFAMLSTAAVLFSDGKTRRARRILFIWSLCAFAYAAILIGAAKHPRESAFQTGVPYCEDDVCIAIDQLAGTPIPSGTLYRLAIHLSSRANHGPRSVAGASIYLTDEHNRIFPLQYDPSVTPLDAVLQPGASIPTTLTFRVPADAQKLFFAACMDHVSYASFILGSPDLLGNPLLKLQIHR